MSGFNPFICVFFSSFLCCTVFFWEKKDIIQCSANIQNLFFSEQYNAFHRGNSEIVWKLFLGWAELELNKKRSSCLNPLTLQGMAGISPYSIGWGSNALSAWLIVFTSKACARPQLNACQITGVLTLDLSEWMEILNAREPMEGAMVLPFILRTIFLWSELKLSINLIPSVGLIGPWGSLCFHLIYLLDYLFLELVCWLIHQT